MKEYFNETSEVIVWVKKLSGSFAASISNAKKTFVNAAK